MGRTKNLSHPKHPKTSGTRRKPISNRAKFMWIGGSLIALLVGVLALVLANQKPPFEPEVAGAPSAQLDQTEIDYGDVRLGRTINTVFTVRNVGDQPLRIGQDPQVELVEGC